MQDEGARFDYLAITGGEPLVDDATIRRRLRKGRVLRRKAGHRLPAVAFRKGINYAEELREQVEDARRSRP